MQEPHVVVIVDLAVPAVEAVEVADKVHLEQKMLELHVGETAEIVAVAAVAAVDRDKHERQISGFERIL